jgi:hypothetical protein
MSPNQPVSRGTWAGRRARNPGGQLLTRSRLLRRVLPVTAAASAAALTLGLTAASGATTRTPAAAFTFSLVPSPGITACLPHASGSATITRGSVNDTMTVSVSGLPANTGFDLFVIQVPNKPFGVAWYQTDVHTGSGGSGSATVKGVFNVETFSVSAGGTVTFSPTHQYHLGLWFNSPQKPFNLGCEPGATSPVVTPFNGQQHAGIQVLNTANFPDNAGPLSHVSA